jgi:hypothetical protein
MDELFIEARAEDKAEQIQLLQTSLELPGFPDQFTFNPLVVGSNPTRPIYSIN